MSSSRVVVHLSVQGFFEACRTREIDAIVSSTSAFDRALSRHARGWTKPSADEAELSGEPPWGERGSPMDWAEGLKADVGEGLSLPVSIGIASSRFASRICARLARPGGILLWMDGHEACLMEGLPLEELDELRDDQLGRLRAGGVRTIDELARLGPEAARELLGSEGEKLVGLVREADGMPEPDFSKRPRRELVLLARRLARRLGGSHHRARGLELRLAFQDGVVHERYSLLPHATDEATALLDTAERLLALCPRRALPVAGIALSATGLTGTEGQLDLFGGPPRDIVVCIGRAATDTAVDELTPRPDDRYAPPTFPGGNINEESANPAGRGVPSRGLCGPRFGGRGKLDRLHLR